MPTSRAGDFEHIGGDPDSEVTTSSQHGSFKITVVKARLTRDVESFGKMDPYAKVTYESKSYVTDVQDDVGKNPVWNKMFSFDVFNNKSVINIQVFDEGTISDTLIGGMDLPLKSLISNDSSETLYDIQYKGKKAGAITLKTEWIEGNAESRFEMVQI